MREILFRGKRIDNGEWVEGCYSHNNKLHWIFVPNEDDYTFVIPNTVGQYTGLTDKNGTKIFEGDVVKCPTANAPEEKGFVCVFNNSRWEFNNVNFPDDDYLGTVNYQYISGNTEVIGNIHDGGDNV